MKKKKDNATLLGTTTDVWNWLRNADLDIVLPLIVFMAEHDNIDLLYKLTRRLRKNHYDGVWNKKGDEQSRRGKNYMDWRYLVQIISKTTDDTLLTADMESLNISKIPMVNIPVWCTDDEVQKTKLRDLLPIEEMEDNEFLMGDLWPLWHSDNQEVHTVDEIMRRWNILKEMCQSFYPDEAANHVQFANWFRLYRLATGLIGLHHVNNCQRTFEGCFYSLKPNDPWWIEDSWIEQILKSDSPIDYIKESVKEKIAPFIHNPNNHQELVVSWMALKTIQAEKGEYLLNYWNDRAISAFLNIKENFIIPMDDFHWGNIFCGYSYSYTVFPARRNETWIIKSYLDSPLTSLDFIPNFYDRATDVISMETIEKGDKEVKELIDWFL